MGCESFKSCLPLLWGINPVCCMRYTVCDMVLLYEQVVSDSHSTDKYALSAARHFAVNGETHVLLNVNFLVTNALK